MNKQKSSHDMNTKRCQVPALLTGKQTNNGRLSVVTEPGGEVVEIWLDVKGLHVKRQNHEEQVMSLVDAVDSVEGQLHFKYV